MKIVLHYSRRHASQLTACLGAALLTILLLSTSTLRADNVRSEESEFMWLNWIQAAFIGTPDSVVILSSDGVSSEMEALVRVHSILYWSSRIDSPHPYDFNFVRVRFTTSAGNSHIDKGVPRFWFVEKVLISEDIADANLYREYSIDRAHSQFESTHKLVSHLLASAIDQEIPRNVISQFPALSKSTSYDTLIDVSLPTEDSKATVTLAGGGKNNMLDQMVIQRSWQVVTPIVVPDWLSGPYRLTIHQVER